ncbi:MAG: class I SAM-dependent methyltransferase [Thaumarchaeota archaeon]|nr:class I SAM-dependent methyltransferase [Nitrososphaerota archaeon]
MFGIYKSLKTFFGPFFGYLLRRRYRLPARLLELRLASRLGNPVNERIIEYPWVLEQIKMRKEGKILDVGCGWPGLLSSYLLSKGYDAYGLDIMQCNTLPRDRFFLSDARKTNLPDASFDTIILLSTLEHIGSDEEEDDLKTMHEMSRLLKKGGALLFTTPFAAKYSNRGQRFFSEERLEKITKFFKVLNKRHFIQKGSKWTEVSMDDAEGATWNYTGVHSIAIVAMVLEKE